MESVLIIGMGKFGSLLASKMQELGNDVMIVDKNETIVNELAPHFTNALIGDATNLDVLKSLGVNNFDICFVTIGEDFQSSLEITSLLKELGAKYVISKAKREIQAKFLLRNGADEIVYPEKEVAIKLAVRCNTKNIFDYIELTSEYAIFEIALPKKWAGKSLREVNARKQFYVNVLAIKKGGTLLIPIPDPDYSMKKEDHIIILGKESDVSALTRD